MSIYLKALVPGSLLTAVVASYYAPAAGLFARISAATITNSDTVARTVTVYLVPNAGAPGAANACLLAKPLQPNETYDCPELIGKVLGPGASLQALASFAAVVGLQVSGLEQGQP